MPEAIIEQAMAAKLISKRISAWGGEATQESGQTYAKLEEKSKF